MKATKRILSLAIVIIMITTPNVFAGDIGDPATGERYMIAGERVSPGMQESLIRYEPDSGGEGFPIGIGPEKSWRLGAGFQYKAAYDSNIDRDPKGQEKNDIIFSYLPSIAVRREGAVVKVRSELELGFVQYLKNKENNYFPADLYNYLQVNGGKTTITLSHRLGHTLDLVSSEQTQQEKTFYNNIHLEVAYALTPKVSLAVLYGNDLVYYPDNEANTAENDLTTGGSATEDAAHCDLFVDDKLYMRNDLGGRAYYHATPLVDLFVGSTASRYDSYSSGSDNGKGYSIYAGSVGRMIEKFIFTFQGGFRNRSYDQGNTAPSNGFFGGAIANYVITPKIDTTLSVNRDIATSRFNGAGYYDVSRANLNFGYKMTPLMTLNVGSGFQIDSYPNSFDSDCSTDTGANATPGSSATTDATSTSDTRKDYLTNAHIRLQYEPIRNWHVGAGYRFELRNSKDQNSDYVDHYFEASIAYKYW